MRSIGLKSLILLSGSFFAFLISCNENNSANSNYAQSSASSVEVFIPQKDAQASIDAWMNHCSIDSLLVFGEGYEKAYEYHISSKPEEINVFNRLVCLIQQGEEFDPLEDANPEEFTGVNIAKDRLENARISIFKDVWARSQTVISINLDESIDAADWMSENVLEVEKVMVECIQKMDLFGIEGFAPPKSNKYADSIQRIVKNSYGIQIPIPRNFRVLQSDSNFLWLGSVQKDDGYESLLIQLLPESVKLNSLFDMVNNRDSFTRNVLHNDEGTSIVVSMSGAYRPSIILPKPSKVLNAMRGWYAEYGTFRRGPFERYYVADSKNHRIIAIDWFAGGKNAYNQTSQKMRLIIQRYLNQNP